MRTFNFFTKIGSRLERWKFALKRKATTLGSYELTSTKFGARIQEISVSSNTKSNLLTQMYTVENDTLFI